MWTSFLHHYIEPRENKKKQQQYTSTDSIWWLVFCLYIQCSTFVSVYMRFVAIFATFQLQTLRTFNEIKTKRPQWNH